MEDIALNEQEEGKRRRKLGKRESHGKKSKLEVMEVKGKINGRKKTKMRRKENKIHQEREREEIVE